MSFRSGARLRDADPEEVNAANRVEAPLEPDYARLIESFFVKLAVAPRLLLLWFER